MGFYIRKSFRAGPIRFNLSKSGIGLSTGIKGFRVGMGSRGAYISGGAHGIYFRENLGTGRKLAAGKNSSLPNKGSNLPNQKINPVQPKLFLLVASGLFIFLFMVLLGVWYVGLIWALCVVVISHKRINYTKALNNYLELLDQITVGEKLMEIDWFPATRKKWTFKSREVHEAHKSTYKRLVFDSMVNYLNCNELLRFKDLVAETFCLTNLEKVKLETEAFKELVWNMLADQELSPREEEVLAVLYSTYGIDKDSVQDELRVIGEYLRAAKIGREELPELKTPFILQKGEKCHYLTGGAIYEMKKQGLTLIHEGEIYITSKRIMVVGAGISVIPHTKVLDVEVDFDHKLITITKDGREKPLYIGASDAIFCGKLIEHLSQQ
jgi:Protein of unknown function (DUF4236)